MGDDAGSLSIIATASGPLTGIGGFNLDDGKQGRYATASPDRLAPFGSSQIALNYAGSSSMNAGIARDNGTYRVLVLAFPIETVTDENARRSLMESSLNYLLGVPSGGGLMSGGGSQPGSVSPSGGLPVANPGSVGPIGSSSSGSGGCDVLAHQEGGTPMTFFPLICLCSMLLLLRRRR